METPAHGGVVEVAAVAADSAARLREAVPHTAAAASDHRLLDAVARVAELGRACQLAMGVLAAEVATRSARVDGIDTLATRNGQKDAAGLLQLAGRVSRDAARRYLAYGEAIVDRDALTGAPLPPRWERVSEAAFAGEVDAEAVVPVLRHLEEVRLSADSDLLDAAESGMMRIASQGTPEYTGQQMRVWKEALDPDGARPREEKQRRSRFFRIGRENSEGMTPVRGLLTPEAGAHLRTALSTFTNPRVSRVAFPTEAEQQKIDELEAALPDGVGTYDLDPRTRDQKLHDILDGLITSGHRAAASGGDNRRTMTQLIATIGLDELRCGDGVAWVDGMSEPLGPATTERIRCDQGFRTLLLGDEGEALWLGKKREMFTRKQKLAIAARDGGCAWPGCDAPAEWCEVHHVTYRRNGGTTDIDNGILLCGPHHHVLHAQDWDIRMSEGVPYLRPPAYLHRGDGQIRLGQNRVREVRRLRRQRRRANSGSAKGADPPDTG